MRRRHTDIDPMRAFTNIGLLVIVALFWYAVYEAFKPVLQ